MEKIIILEKEEFENTTEFKSRRKKNANFKRALV